MVRVRLASVVPVVEVVVAAAAVVVVVALAGAPRLGGALDPAATLQVLTLVAAAVAAGGAVLAALVARLSGDPGPRWFAAGLAVYAAVVLPVTALSGPGTADLPLSVLRIVSYVLMIGLFVGAVRPPAGFGTARTWGVAVAGLGVAVLAAVVAPRVPGVLRPLVDGWFPTLLVITGWTAIAAALTVRGLRRRSAARTRVGLGLVVVAGAQLHRVLTAADVDVVFGALRALGLLLVVAGLAELVGRTLAELRDERFAQQEELAVAALHMERAGELAAERDHELRNGLAGLAGITHLLSAPGGDAEHDRLRHAVLAELGRLRTLLDDARVEPEPEDYRVAPVLEGLAALRDGVDLDADPDLRAVGDPAVLAQVVTNLLANCHRHAPGAAVAVRARERDGRAVVEVRDAGPGLPPGVEVLDRGVHDTAAGGSGLGLAISARLVAGEGGSLDLRTVDDPRGALATVTLPLGARTRVGAS